MKSARRRYYIFGVGINYFPLVYTGLPFKYGYNVYTFQFSYSG